MGHKDFRGSRLKARPFLKWAGGKGQLLDQLTTRLPKSFARYFEPFLGGGALYFATRPKEAFLSDINRELINTYRQVADDCLELISKLKVMPHCKDFYYSIRSCDRQSGFALSDPLERASRFVYLNRTCFNGLYRVNRKGEFNVSFGDYSQPRICDEENLLACSRLLSGASLQCADFGTIEFLVRPGDFVYLDPPYVPTSSTANFTGYSCDRFTLKDHEKLFGLCQRLDSLGVFWMLSNSASAETIDCLSHFNVELVEAARAINSNGEKRGKVREIIVRNYE